MTYEEALKDCIHYDVCFDNIAKNSGDCVKCSHFADKSRFIELPCKIGNTIYAKDDEAETKNIKADPMTEEEFRDKYCKMCGTQLCGGVTDEIFRDGCEHYIKEFMKKVL